MSHEFGASLGQLFRCVSGNRAKWWDTTSRHEPLDQADSSRRTRSLSLVSQLDRFEETSGMGVTIAVRFVNENYNINNNIGLFLPSKKCLNILTYPNPPGFRRKPKVQAGQPTSVGSIAHVQPEAPTFFFFFFFRVVNALLAEEFAIETPGVLLDDLDFTWFHHFICGIFLDCWIWNSSVILKSRKRLWTDEHWPEHYASVSSPMSVTQKTSDELMTFTERCWNQEKCKPCIFIRAACGCAKGIECPFCHMSHKFRMCKGKQPGQMDGGRFWWFWWLRPNMWATLWPLCIFDLRRYFKRLNVSQILRLS